MSLNYEMSKYTELTGEDGTKVPVSRLGGFLDGYYKGKIDTISVVKNIIQNYHAHIENDVIGMIFRDLEQLKE